MNDNFKSNNKIINLFDYASHKQPPPSMHSKPNQSISFSQKSGNSLYGFDTLLHFNDSLNISSIQSHKEKRLLPKDQSSYANRSSHYESLINRAKQDAKRLKNRRMEQQLMWKKTHRHVKLAQQQHGLDESLAESQVTSYNLDSQVYPIKNTNRREHEGEQDSLALELKRSIYEGKVKSFTQTIKDLYMLNFIAQLKFYSQIKDFKKEWSRSLAKNVFISWKRLTKQTQSRKYIRAAVLARIKARKSQQHEEEYLQNILNN